MSFKLLSLNVTAMIIALGSAACAPHAKHLETEQREDRIIKMLDERRYDDAIALADSSGYEAYRAEAYLGKSGFIPLEFAVRVMGAQSVADATPRDSQLAKLIPGCDAQGLPAMKGVPYRCALWRILRQLPDVNQSDFAQAREILRAKYPDPQNTPPGYNALCGIVEMASLLATFRTILIDYQQLDPEKASDAEIQSVFDEIAHFSEFARETLRRARVVSYLSLSHQLAGLEKEAFFSGNRFNLDYIEQSGIPLVIRIAQSTGEGLDVIGGKIMMIQQLDQVIQKLQTE